MSKAVLTSKRPVAAHGDSPKEDKPKAPDFQARKITCDKLERFAVHALERAGLSSQNAKIAAEVLATTDAWGTHTHGTKLLRGYLKRLKGGGLRANGQPRIVAEGPAWANIDGDSSLAMVTSIFAMQTAIAKARTCGIACVGVRNSCHFGAAEYSRWTRRRRLRGPFGKVPHDC
jgi:ureidoglycolate dehydrogenase (NAD+)